MTKEAISIAVKSLSVSYEKKRVLTNIFLDFEEGNLYGIIRPNGAGKSTLFKAILGLIEAYSGEVNINSQAIEKQRKKIVYVPQKSEVDWSFPATVFDIVLIGATIIHLTPITAKIGEKQNKKRISTPFQHCYLF